MRADNPSQSGYDIADDPSLYTSTTIIVTVGLVSETNTVHPAGQDQATTVGIVTETSTAFPVLPPTHYQVTFTDVSLDGQPGIVTFFDWYADATTPQVGDMAEVPNFSSDGGQFTLRSDGSMTLGPPTSGLDTLVDVRLRPLGEAWGPPVTLQMQEFEQVIDVGLITEANTVTPAVPVTGIVIPVGTVTETSTVFPTTGAIEKTVGPLQESNTVTPALPTAGAVINVGLVSETNQALPVTIEQNLVRTVGIVSERNTVFRILQADKGAAGRGDNTVTMRGPPTEQNEEILNFIRKFLDEVA